MANYINPFTDIGFKRIFGQEFSKPLLIDFLNNLLIGEKRIVDFEKGVEVCENDFDRWIYVLKNMNTFGRVLESPGLTVLGRRISHDESSLTDINSNVGHSLNNLLRQHLYILNHHCECGVKSPLNYPVSDVKVWGQNIFYGLFD